MAALTAAPAAQALSATPPLGPSAPPAPQCEICEEESAVVFCPECQMYLCDANGCFTDIHRPRSKALHRAETLAGAASPLRPPQDARAPAPDGLARRVSLSGPALAQTLPPGSRVCEICDEAQAAVYCPDCRLHLCRLKGCVQELHKPRKMAFHRPTELAATAAAAAAPAPPLQRRLSAPAIVIGDSSNSGAETAKMAMHPEVRSLSLSVLAVAVRRATAAHCTGRSHGTRLRQNARVQLAGKAGEEVVSYLIEELRRTRALLNSTQTQLDTAKEKLER
jgi:hypothetical protein